MPLIGHEKPVSSGRIRAILFSTLWNKRFRILPHLIYSILKRFRKVPILFDIELPGIDLAIIALYFAVVLTAGFWFTRKSARNMDSYFLGNKALPWWMLGLSGSASNFDITGTMWLVSLIYLLGFKAFWVFWIYAFLIGAFFMSYMGRWLRRTEAMTAAELIRVRFGEDTGGRIARTAAGSLQVLQLLFMVGYAFQGIGKFASTYLPFSPTQCAAMIMGVTALYVVLGGFRSVIATDVIQAIILNVGALIVAIFAFIHIDPEVLHEKMSPSFLPVERAPEVVGTPYASYETFGLLCVIWVITGLLKSLGAAAGGYGEQRFLATRNVSDAAKAGAGWSLFLFFRWGMVAGIVYLAVTGPAGMEDSEKVLPTILRDYMPDGIRGFILAGLIAAFMSTFSSTLNAGASILVRDLVQPFLPRLGEKHLIRISYLCTAGIVIVGLLIGTQAESINHIWTWICIGLSASVIIPSAMWWYWWRMNGWGYSIGVFSGAVLSLLVLFMPDMPEYVYAPVINGVALLGCIFGSLATRPMEKQTLLLFYRKVRPKGFWKPVKHASGISDETLSRGLDRTWRIVANVLLGTIAIFFINLFPFYLVGHWFAYAAATLAVFIACCATLYFTWYRKLDS